ncbi:hypothetical protein GIB67_027323 [Kingdonia uniflora]|uniref:Acid phosphatase n=1 Tax=Kingdonia uniflora TaxID=39325 RepID=A0A7J7MEY4_9MAGN|nr:hypothetical protein GIB67_027323 [Kingdonia uniflora]
MPSFADQMEHSDSAHSFSSRQSSGSLYMLESGLHISSCAATIFISALITLGVLFITLVVMLTVMLQSCQNKSNGSIENWRANEEYQYCRIWALHAELNKLEEDAFPAKCISHVVQRIKQHHYLRDLNLTSWVAKNYFSSLKPKDDGRDGVLIDIDDFLMLFHAYHANLLQNSLVEEVKHQTERLLIELHMKLRASGWPLIFVSRKPEMQRKNMVENLISSGYGGWSSLIMRSDDEMQMETSVYFSKKRMELQGLGFRIIAVISSQMDALTGPCSGIRLFKLPNPINYNPDLHNDMMQKSQ